MCGHSVWQLIALEMKDHEHLRLQGGLGHFHGGSQDARAPLHTSSLTFTTFSPITTLFSEKAMPIPSPRMLLRFPKSS